MYQFILLSVFCYSVSTFIYLGTSPERMVSNITDVSWWVHFSESFVGLYVLDMIFGPKQGHAIRLYGRWRYGCAVIGGCLLSSGKGKVVNAPCRQK